MSKSLQFNFKRKNIQQVLYQMNQKIVGSPEQTFLMLECGSLDLQNIIEKAFVMIGNTKAGKTTSGHYMIGSQLVGIQNNAKSVIYGLRTGKNISKIGEHESDSETQIPNFFDFKLGEKIAGIDCPGFLDSFGCFRIISNVYFIQKVLSIVKKIKFIIVVKYIHLLSTADGLRSTFISFLNMFKDPSSIIDKVLPCISLLITEVPLQIDQQRLKQKYSLTPSIGVSKYNQCYEKIKECLINNNKIFMIKKAQLGKIADVENKLVSKIDSRSQFWQRPINQYDRVSTIDFRLTINQHMDKDSQLFLKELNNFSQYFNSKLAKNLQTLIGIFQRIIQSAETDEPLNFMNKISTFLQSKEADVKKLGKQYLDLYSKYSEKRKIAITQLFDNFDKDGSNELSINKVNNKDIPFSLLKMKAIKKLSDIAQTVLQLKKDRQISTTKKQIQLIKQILKIFILLSKRNNAHDQQRALKFSYEIFKQSQLMNQIYEIFVNTADDKNKNDIAKKQTQFIFYQWPERLRRTFHFFPKNRSYYQMLIEYIENLNPKLKYNNPKIYLQFINFISQLKYVLQSKGNKQMLQNYQISQQQYKFSIKMCDRKLNALNLKLLQYNAYQNTDKPDKTISELEELKQTVMKSILRQEQDPQDSDDEQVYDENLTSNIQISQILGFCSQKKDKQFAKQIYECLSDAFQVLQMYKIQQDKMDKDYHCFDDKCKNQLMNLCFQYAKKAYIYCRMQLAIEKGQKAYSFAQKLGDKDKMLKIGKFLYKIYPNVYDKDETNDQEQGQQDQQLKNIEKQRIRHVQAMNNGFFKVNLPEKSINKEVKIKSKSMSPKKI